MPSVNECIPYVDHEAAAASRAPAAMFIRGRRRAAQTDLGSILSSGYNPNYSK